MLRDNVFLRHGYPAMILTDNATSFRNQLMDAYAALHGIDHASPAPYHPQSNGAVERVMRALKERLGIVFEQAKSFRRVDPRLLARRFAFAHNTTRHETLGESPYFAMFGREARTAQDACLGITGVTVAPDDLEALYDDIVMRTVHAHQQAKTRHDKHRTDWRPKVGDAVFVRWRGNDDPQGPYAVDEIRGNHVLVRNVRTGRPAKVHLQQVERGGPLDEGLASLDSGVAAQCGSERR